MYRFYDSASANEPVLNQLVYFLKSIKKLKQDFEDFDESDIDKKLDKIEGFLDQNDKMLIEISNGLEEILK